MRGNRRTNAGNRKLIRHLSRPIYRTMYPVIVYPVPCWCAYVEGDITHMSGVAIASVYAAAHVSALANMAQHRGALVAAWMHDAVCGDYYAGPCFTIALHKVLAVDPHRVDAAFEAFEAFEAFATILTKAIAIGLGLMVGALA